MPDEKPLFTSDRRAPSASSWVGDEDWKAGSPSNIGVVDGALVPQLIDENPVGSFSNVVDVFGDGDLSEYSYSGTRGNYNVVSSGPRYGDENALQASISSGSGGNIQIQSEEGAGLTDYPQEGDTVRIWSHIADLRGCTHRFVMGTEYGYGEGIFSGIDAEGNNTDWRFVLGDRSGGSSTAVSIADPRNRDQFIEMQKDGSTAVAKLLDEHGDVIESLSISTTDWSSENGVGFHHNTNGGQRACEAYFAHYVIV